MSSINEMIDHTMLKPDATKDDILKIIKEAQTYKFGAVCINPYWVPFVKENLESLSVSICTVIGFPLGANTTEVKSFEASEAINNGANEVDMVINIGALKSKLDQVVLDDIKSVVKVAKDRALVKVIIETSLLTNSEIVRACELASEAGADFVKTSTGFSNGGAKVEDVKLMRNTVGKDMGVKASGGIHSAEEALLMIEAGANRIGTSASIVIINGNT